MIPRPSYTIIAVLALLLCGPLSPAQNTRRERQEDINRHRPKLSDAPVMQSWGDESQLVTSQSFIDTTIVINTWSFVEYTSNDEEEPETLVEPENTIEGMVAVAPDTTILGRLAHLEPSLLLPFNDKLRSHILNYVEGHKNALRYMLGKYFYHEPVIKEIFRRNGVPTDLTALALVESAMNPTAVSPAGATGMWQFMSYTAPMFGLRCDELVDERLDAYKSADAAAKFLKRAYTRYGNWTLAISSYNCGRGNVDEAIAKAHSTDFWDIYEYLPKETRGYMPAFVAALYSVYFYAFHGIEPKSYNVNAFYTFIVKEDLAFDEIEEITGMTYEQVKKLNPQYIKGFIPGADRPYTVKIPVKYAKMFTNYLNK